MKSRSAWFENGTEKARKQRNENSKRLIKSAILGNADTVLHKKVATEKTRRIIFYVILLRLNPLVFVSRKILRCTEENYIFIEKF